MIMNVFAITPFIFMILLYLIPIVLVVLLIRWIWGIKKNSEVRVLQNKQIIELLTELKEKKSNAKE